MKIFVISLKDAQRRRKIITKKMQEMNLDIEFFDAVNGHKGLPKKYEFMIDRNLAEKRLGKDMSDGEIACALSHALVYKKIMNEQIEHSIILEDDAIIGTDFANMVKKKCCEASGKDFIYLYHLYARVMRWGLSSFMNGYVLNKPAKTPNGAVAYYINLKMSTELYNKVLPISWVSDWGIDIASYNTALIIPRIVTHPTMEESNLQDTRTGKNRIFFQFGVMSWMSYKIKKIFSYKVSKNIDGE